MRPEDALAEARRRAGAIAPEAASTAGAALAGEEAAARRRELARWALIEPDRAAVYSTRRLGAPVTALKRLLVRMVGQYLDGATSQQSRFNAHVVAYALALEDRIALLEAQVRELQSRDR